MYILYWLIYFFQSCINFLRKVLQLLYRWIYSIDLFYEAFWLSILSADSLEKLTSIKYKLSTRYRSDENNLKGLFSWEQKIADQFVSASKKVVIIGAGGGREAFALVKLGCEVRAFEADEKMVKYARDYIRNKKLDIRFDNLPVNRIPDVPCQVFWMGWGVYTHLMGLEERVKLLKEIKTKISDDGIIIISYWVTKDYHVRFNAINRFAKKINRRKLEFGEYFKNGMWAKYYSSDEIIEECRLAGLHAIYISEEEYGHAVLGKI